MPGLPCSPLKQPPIEQCEQYECQNKTWVLFGRIKWKTVVTDNWHFFSVKTINIVSIANRERGIGSEENLSGLSLKNKQTKPIEHLREEVELQVLLD